MAVDYTWDNIDLSPHNIVLNIVNREDESVANLKSQVRCIDSNVLTFNNPLEDIITGNNWIFYESSSNRIKKLQIPLCYILWTKRRSFNSH